MTYMQLFCCQCQNPPQCSPGYWSQDGYNGSPNIAVQPKPTHQSTWSIIAKPIGCPKSHILIRLLAIGGNYCAPWTGCLLAQVIILYNCYRCWDQVSTEHILQIWDFNIPWNIHFHQKQAQNLLRLNLCSCCSRWRLYGLWCWKI